MRLSTAVEPDCSGRCACSQTAAHSAIAAITSGRKSFGCGLVKRIRSIPSIASTSAQQLGEADTGVRAEVAPVRVDVLAEERDLPDALARRALDLRDDLARPPADLAAADGRDDAVRALRVAAHRDLNPCLETPFAVERQRRREAPLVAGAERAARRRAARAEPLAEVRDRPRAEGDVDERVEIEDPLPLRLRIAAADGDHALRVAILQRFRLREVRREPLVGLLADRARVEDDDVRLVLRDRLAEPDRLEHALDPLRVVRVHLAAERRHEVPLHGGQCTRRISSFGAGWASLTILFQMDAAAAVQAYIEGWTTGWQEADAEAIGALYADDAVFRSHPFREPETSRATMPCARSATKSSSSAASASRSSRATAPRSSTGRSSAPRVTRRRSRESRCSGSARTAAWSSSATTGRCSRAASQPGSDRQLGRLDRPADRQRLP